MEGLIKICENYNIEFFDLNLEMLYKVNNTFFNKVIEHYEKYKYDIISDILILTNKKNIYVSNKEYTGLVTSECITLGTNCLDLIKKCYFYTTDYYSDSNDELNHLYFSFLLKNQSFQNNERYGIMKYNKFFKSYSIEYFGDINYSTIQEFLYSLNLTDYILYHSYDLEIKNELFCIYNKHDKSAYSVVKL